MKPRGMRSKWVKLLPWYYTKRRQPTRAVEREMAIEDDLAAVAGPELDYERMVDRIQSLPPLEPIEPIKLTRNQWALIKLRVELIPTPPWRVPTVNPLFGTPIRIVETVEESTPYLKDWAGWPEAEQGEAG